MGYFDVFMKTESFSRMKKTLFLVPFLAVLLIWGCKDKQYLVGYYNYASFQKECRWDHFTDEKYKPNQKWLDSLATLSIKDSVSMKLFLGCYCGDSKKWVPRFYDLKPQLPISTVEIISVDTTKKDEKKNGAGCGIEKNSYLYILSGW